MAKGIQGMETKEVTLKNPLMERYYKLPKELQLKISFNDFARNTFLIELVVETMKNIIIGRYAIYQKTSTYDFKN